MYFAIAFFVGIFLGIFAEAWAHKLPTPLPSAHEYCEERFNRMCRRLRLELQAKEEEIQRLIHG